MNAWNFVLGAYVVTAILIVVEVIAVRARYRAALDAADLTHSASKTERT